MHVEATVRDREGNLPRLDGLRQHLPSVPLGLVDLRHTLLLKKSVSQGLQTYRRLLADPELDGRKLSKQRCSPSDFAPH